MHTELYNKLSVYTLTEKQIMESHHMGYKYLVYRNWMNYTAFKTRMGLNYWLECRHLSIDGKVTDGESNTIDGEYIKISLLHIDPILPDYSNSQNLKNWEHESFDSFGLSNSLQKIYLMDNGDYTSAYVYHGINANVYPNKNPMTTIYYLNPNCKRIVYNWRDFEDGIPINNNPSILEKQY